MTGCCGGMLGAPRTGGETPEPDRDRHRRRRKPSSAEIRSGRTIWLDFAGETTQRAEVHRHHPRKRNGSRTSMDNGSRFADRSLVEDPGTKEEMATHTKGTRTGGVIDEETVTLRISLLNLEAVRLGDIPADKVTGHDRSWGQPTLVQHLGRRKPFHPCGQMVA